MATALNLAIKRMSGDYFSWLSHDDVYYPDKIRKQIQALSKEREIKIPFTDYEYIDSASKVMRAVKLKHKDPSNILYDILMKNYLHGCSLLIHKQCFTKNGLFDESLRTTQDGDMWFRLAQSYSFMHIDKVLVQGRAHDEQVSIRKKHLHARERDKFTVDGIRFLIANDSKYLHQKSHFMFFIHLSLYMIIRKSFSVLPHSIYCAFKYAHKR